MMTLDSIQITSICCPRQSLSSKNNRGTRQKWWGNGVTIVVASAVCRSWTWHLSAFASGWEHLILSLHLPTWVWVIPFDLSSAYCLVTMTSARLMSNTAKFTVVSLICSREVDLCRITTSLWYLTWFWFTTIFFLYLVSMMWETLWPTFDQGRFLSTSTHYPGRRSRDSFPVP